MYKHPLGENPFPPEGVLAPSGDKVSQESDFYVRCWLVARIGDQFLNLFTHREVQVQAFRWDRAFEPLAVDLVDFAGLVQGDDGAIYSLLEGRVVFTNHAGVGFEGLWSPGDHPVVGLLGLGFFTGQQGVVHHEGDGAAAFEHLEGFAVVFGGDDVHAHLLVGVHRLDDALGRGTGGGHDVLAFQVSEVGVARLAILVFLDQQAGADFEDVDGEINLLGAFGVVGGGAALEVRSAVLDQRDTGLRGDQVVLGLQIGFVQVFFQLLDDGQLNVVGVAHRFTRTIRDVGKRNGAVAVSESDGAGVVDFLQRAGEFGGENWSADQSSSDSCAQNMGNDAHQYFLDICFFYEAG